MWAVRQSSYLSFPSSWPIPASCSNSLFRPKISISTLAAKTGISLLKLSEWRRNLQAKRIRIIKEGKVFEDKLDSSYSKKPSDETDTVVIEPHKDSLQCDQSEYNGKCKLDVRKHIESKHKTIPQLDGHMDAELEKAWKIELTQFLSLKY